MGSGPCGGVADDPLELLRIATSPTRLQILKLLRQGFDHPEDLAKKMKIRRQAVDKQLSELFYWGLVDRSAIFAATGRPKIVYRLTRRGSDLANLLERAAADYRASFRGDLEQEIEALEVKLAAGEIAEEMYFKKRKEIEARYKWVAGP